MEKTSGLNETGYPNREVYWLEWQKGKSPQEIAQELTNRERLAEIDQLTNLKNRRGWDNVLKTLIPLAQENRWEVSFLVLDIDELNKINDVWGHEAGDQAIIFLASVIESNVRKTDAVARVGGDEFYVCLPQTNLQEARMIVERVKGMTSDVGRSMEKDSLIYQILPTISIGASQLGVSESPEKAIGRADKHMYQIKNKDGK